MSKNNNVLASNPLDFMFGGEQPKADNEKAPEPEPAVKKPVVKKPAPVVAAPAPERQEPEEEPPETLRVVPQKAPAAPPKPARKRRRKPAPPPAPEAEGEGSRSQLNRIGTIQQPYTRSDGTQTRQASVTLPVELLKRLGHCSIDTGMKTSQIVRHALESYFDEQGY